MTTFAALKTQAATRWRDASNAVIGDTQWGEYINQAYQHANTSSPLWPWLEVAPASVTVLANTNSIALPTDTVQVNSVYNTTDNYRMIPDDGRGDQYRSGFLRTDTGQPVIYRIRSGTLEVMPMPTANTTFELEAVTMPVRLTGTNSPVWPSHFHEALLDGALALAFLDDGNTEFHNTNWAKFEQSIKNMLNTVLMFRTEANYAIRDRFWE